MREHWGSRLGFVLAAAGSAIGLGTLWKFPYVTGDNGGGLFVLFYLVFTLFIGIPLFIGELVLGRRGQRGAVGTFSALAGETTNWRVIGWLGVLSSLFILSYYCVIAGWGLCYLMMSLNQFYIIFPRSEVGLVFDRLYSSGDISLFWAFLFLILSVIVVYQGVRKGIELWSKVLTTALLVVLIGLTLFAITLDGFGEALDFLFSSHSGTLKPSGILEALGLSFFTLSIAQGILLTYGSYLRPSEDIPKTAFMVGGMVMVVALLVVLMIFPVIFTFGLTPSEGAGLVFKTLPVLFAALPGSFILSILFFALFTFTALTSAVALLEVIAANLIDLFQWSRHKAVLTSAVFSFALGIPSALSGARDLFKAWLPMYGMNFFVTIDTLVSVWLLPIGGLLLAIFLGFKLEKAVIREEFLSGTSFRKLFTLWYFIVKWVAPVAIALVFLQRSGLIHIDNLLAISC